MALTDRHSGTPYLILPAFWLGAALGGTHDASEDGLDLIQKHRLAQGVARPLVPTPQLSPIETCFQFIPPAPLRQRESPRLA